LFVNLYVQKPDFGEHNFSDFLNRIEPVEAVYIRKHIESSYSDEFEIEPYFFEMMRLTLSAGAAAAYLRKHPDLPITERDCLLSKLFQFLYVPMEIRFGLPESPDWEMRISLEELLESLPDHPMSRLQEFDWRSFYEDTCCQDLETVLSRLRKRPPAASLAHGNKRGQGRKRGPKADLSRHRQIAGIVNEYGENWRDDEHLSDICEDLDKAGIKVSPKWPKWKEPARSFRRARQERKHEVIKAIQYSIDRS
jgi:hypothetical protein